MKNPIKQIEPPFRIRYIISCVAPLIRTDISKYFSLTVHKKGEEAKFDLSGVKDPIQLGLFK